MTPPRKPRKRKPSRLVTTAFPRVPVAGHKARVSNADVNACARDCAKYLSKMLDEQAAMLRAIDRIHKRVDEAEAPMNHGWSKYVDLLDAMRARMDRMESARTVIAVDNCARPNEVVNYDVGRTLGAHTDLLGDMHRRLAALERPWYARLAWWRP